MGDAPESAAVATEELLHVDPSDPRCDWLCAKACTSLGCEAPAFVELLENPQSNDAIARFLEGGASHMGFFGIIICRPATLRLPVSQAAAVLYPCLRRRVSLPFHPAGGTCRVSPPGRFRVCQGCLTGAACPGAVDVCYEQALLRQCDRFGWFRTNPLPRGAGWHRLTGTHVSCRLGRQ